MDFADLHQQYYKGITFDLDRMFCSDYDAEYTLKQDAFTRVVFDLNLNFSVEVFDAGEAETIQYVFDEETDPLNAVHDNYVIKRLESLEQPVASVKKELPEEIGHKGFIQTIHGTESSYEDDASYFTATIEYKDNYYVFQMIGKRENLGYLYDDFLDILRSVQ